MEDDKKIVVDEIYVDNFKKEQRPRVKSEAELERALGPTLTQARIEVGDTFTFLTHRSLCGAMKYNDSTRGTGENEAIQQAAMRKIEVYYKWAKEVSSKHRGIALDSSAFGFTVKEIAFQRSCSPVTVLKYLRESLNEWSIQRGWGDQLKI